MMKVLFIIVIVIIVVFVLSSCSGGYQKENGQWSWITHDEQFGRRAHLIEGIDNSSFKVLTNKNFGVDNHAAYFKGKKIHHAIPDDFTPLTNNEYGYAKDKNRVFLDNEVILMADPGTFEIIEFPYSKDKNDVYCGTILMKLAENEVNEFRVLNEDKLMAGTKSSTALSHFIELNPDYAWIDTLKMDIKWVIVGEWATGQTGSRRFKGLKEVKN